VEDIQPSHLDPALSQLLARSPHHHGHPGGSREVLRVGDADVDVDPRFRLFLVTRDANPHFSPEVCLQVTLINFTVTPAGLEEQLLAEVVRQERPELEEQRARLITSIAADQRQLQDLEDKTLRLLRECEGNILDDQQLLTTLNSAQLTSAAIQARMREALDTERSINGARESYRPAAVRGSLLYFSIADLAAINPMYQYSLGSFVRLFASSVAACSVGGGARVAPADTVMRLKRIMHHSTAAIFRIVARCGSGCWHDVTPQCLSV
jgi:dynein heavy chain, axonemal